jgi:hypothetical protein
VAAPVVRGERNAAAHGTSARPIGRLAVRALTPLVIAKTDASVKWVDLVDPDLGDLVRGIPRSLHKRDEPEAGLGQYL